MSLFSLIEICCFGTEESSKPNVLLVQEDDDSFRSLSVPSDKKAQDALRIKHQKSVFSSPLEPDDALRFVCEAYPKTIDEENFLKIVFRDHYFFEDLNEAELNEIVNGMEMIEAVAGQEVDSEFMYVVQVGQLSYCCGETEGETSTKVCEGELFCEIDLLYGAKGTNVIVAEVRSILWRFHNFSIRSVLAKQALKNDGDIKTRLRKVELFKDLSEQTINKFADSLTRVNYKAGDRIIAKGETGEIFYIIEQGKVRVHDIGIGDSRVS
jgi:cAMP-dependent protein kinase regulator